jgi:hypothetical protein
MAALDYAGSAALMNDLEFRGRIKVACLKYADFIMLEAASVPAHATRIRWAQNTFLSPDGAAGTVTPAVVMDPAVQAAGATIADPALQSAVENTVNKML